ncbi:hypothetical protein NEMBOFW57_007728 [Staphylotrichum longicolle]|uniref:RING-CH-type domain-containing protein n=1 Tax=Staphylotrichum longicolle TaxID=669026 RepID=A0AAD4I0Q0_9PEZI|nr:hypothetical protein NEMBOFW57_007728 [Staphylotrichum longicolle]
MAAPSHGITPAPVATNDQHVCFICLQNEADTPNATWVNPCPCSLEAHEQCMLRWIAETETSNPGSKGGLKCPACKAPITVEEPYDPLLGIRDKLYRKYSRASPYVLATIVLHGTVAGAASYGYLAAALFSGPDAVSRWLRSATGPRLPSAVVKTMMLAAVGPGLVISRWMPSIASVLLVPCATMYGATLIAQEEFLGWPPSPRWALTMIPFVQLTYSHIVYDLFGPLEKRLNRALRGQPAAEEEVAPADEPAQPVAAPEAAAGAMAAHDDEARGIWNPIGNLGRALLGMFADFPPEQVVGVEVQIDQEFEFRIGGGGDNEDQDLGGQVLGEEDGVNGEDDFQILGEDAAGQPPPEQQQQQPQPPAAEGPAAEEGPAEQPAPPPAQGNQPGPQNQNNQNQRRNNDNNAGADPSAFTILINSLASSLLLPAISYGVGELIRVVAPKAWVARPRWGKTATGLLQERWGRSLAGGCLYIVLRDAIALYTKYRRVQVRAKRRVKNVERRRQGSAGGSGGGL